MKPMQKALHEQIDRLPQIALAKILAPKLKAASIKDYRRKAEQLAQHLLSGNEEPFSWGDGVEKQELVISFTEDDNRKVEELAAKFEGAFRDIVPKLANTMAQRMELESVRRWRESRYVELRDLEGFQLRLEDRWGEGLDHLRVILEVARQVGSEYHAATRVSRARKNRHLRVALSQLHTRACQVAFEILVLLENGLPDGAIARWRTLHEIATVALVIEDGGDEVAERYLAYDAIEAKRALDQYLRDHEALGYAAPVPREIKRTNAAFEAALKQFGEDFRQPYGWAAKFLNLKSPRFKDVQNAAGRAMMQSHYKMASYNVHATPRALSVRLGGLNGSTPLIAGATNAGLDEPGQNMAISLVQLTSLLCAREPQIDDLVMMGTLVRLRDKAVRALGDAGRTLAREDREIRAALAKEGLSVELQW